MRLSSSHQLFNAFNHALAFSIFSLAISLIYFTWHTSEIGRQIPDILDSVEKTRGQIEPVIKQVREIKELVPSILNEVSEIRKQIPIIVHEAELIRGQAPIILDEVSLTRQQISEIIKVVDKTNVVVEQAIAETELVRPLVPKILNEIKTTRETLPLTLDRADILVEKIRETSRDVSRDASEGAVSGFFSGIITAPFNLLGDIGGKVLGLGNEEFKYLTQKDMELFKLAANEVLSAENVNTTKYWKNSDNEIEGKITLIKIDKSGDMLCKILNIKIWKQNKLTTDDNAATCLNEYGEREYDDSEWE